MVRADHPAHDEDDPVKAEQRTDAADIRVVGGARGRHLIFVAGTGPPRAGLLPTARFGGLAGGDHSGRSNPREKLSTAATVRYISHTPVTTWARPSSRSQREEPRLAKKSHT